ncbi:MAG: DUF1294 domain-containing protein [Chthoniobacterales bacterium]
MGEHFQQRQPRSSFFIITAILLIGLLVAPSLACLRLAHSFDPRFVFGYVIAISCLTFWIYWHDKRRAQTGGWRTPESTLHLLELLGGWPAAFIAQRTFRHKISKTRYQVVFWIIVMLNEMIAIDFLCDWHFSKEAIKLLQR